MLLMALGTSIAGQAFAQDARQYPDRPIKLVVPNAPGSSIDTVGRIVASRIGDALGQSMIVENRSGAAGVLGMELGKSSPPDGYTLIVASASNMAVAPLLQKSIPYDPLTDFGFVSLFVVMPNVLVVNTALPVRNVKELIELARAEPGQTNMASAGPGAASHLGGVLLMTMGEFESLHVPYKGGGPSVASVVSGETHWTIAPAPAAMAAVRAGRLRAIAHSLDRRSPMLPDLPTVAETLPGYDYSGWAGLIAPKNTPAPIVEKVREALTKTVAIPAIREALAAQGAEVVTNTPDAFRRFVEQDLANNRRVVKAAKLQAE
jgi:tripartite-type tricarboxylate transporter receptor subunit TctC